MRKVAKAGWPDDAPMEYGGRAYAVWPINWEKKARIGWWMASLAASAIDATDNPNAR